MAAYCKLGYDDCLRKEREGVFEGILKVHNRSSSKPDKVRKRMYLSPQHVVSAQFCRAPLSSDMKVKYSRNTVRVRAGDSVKLVKGEFTGIEGKVQKVFPKEGRVTVEGITREKIAGGTTPVHLPTANLVVTSLNLDDRWRRNKIEGTH